MTTPPEPRESRETQETDSSTGQLRAHQRRGVRVTVVGILLFISIVMGLFLNKLFTPRMLSDVELRANGTYVFDQPRIFKDFQLLDQSGDDFTLQQLPMVAGVFRLYRLSGRLPGHSGADARRQTAAGPEDRRTGAVCDGECRSGAGYGRAAG